MKRKEKEHLKQDPFVHFLEGALGFLKRARRELLVVAAAVVLLVVAVLAVVVWNNVSAGKDNEVFAAAQKLRAADMPLQQKIDGLKRLQPRRGVSAVIPLYIAALLHQQGDTARARTALQAFRNSRIAWVNDEKRLLEADLLAADNQVAPALAALDALLADGKRQVGGDRVLLRKAKLLLKNGRKEEADAVLKKILAEYPESLGSLDARQLLTTLEPGVS